jgi:hypothetical protein
METVQQAVDALVVKVMQQVHMSGLSFDEAIWSLGIAAKAIAKRNAEITGESNSFSVGKENLNDGFAQVPQFIFVGSDMSRLREAYADTQPFIVKHAFKPN